MTMLKRTKLEDVEDDDDISLLTGQMDGVLKLASDKGGFDFSGFTDMLNKISSTASTSHREHGPSSGGVGTSLDNAPFTPLLDQLIDEFETAVTKYSKNVRSKAITRKRLKLQRLNKKNKLRGSSYKEKITVKQQRGVLKKITKTKAKHTR
jgi:hypothetical protein